MTNDPVHEAAQRLQDRLRASPGAISILVDRADLESVVGALMAQVEASAAGPPFTRRARPVGRNERNQKMQLKPEASKTPGQDPPKVD